MWAAALLLMQATASPPPAPRSDPIPDPAPRQEWGACVEEASLRRDDWSEERPGAQRLGDLPPAELMQAMLREVDRCQNPEPPRPAPAAPEPAPRR